MDFVDEVKVYVKAGDGGSGLCSFRREKFIEFGGPNGGDGGSGGDVKFVAVDNISTLFKLKYKPHIIAKNGKQGSSYNRTGECGDDAVIEIPVGTQIFDEFGNLLVDLSVVGQESIVAKGGSGGIGNYRFKSSTNRAPRQFTFGGEGESKMLNLELKLIADVGLVGLPNIGKSTFLASSSAAVPKIADYPFTTLRPNLGVVVVGYEDFVMADIPGIIKGAHLGFGLGHAFLKHMERCKVILHMIDAASHNIEDDYNVALNELKKYNEDICKKEQVLALTRCDLVCEDDLLEKKDMMEKFTKKRVFLTSFNERSSDLLNFLSKIVQTTKPKEKLYDPYSSMKKR